MLQNTIRENFQICLFRDFADIPVSISNKLVGPFLPCFYYFSRSPCVSLLFVGYIAGNGSVPLCNIDDGEDTDFVAGSEKAKLMMGKRKEISFNHRAAIEQRSEPK